MRRFALALSLLVVTFAACAPSVSVPSSSPPTASAPPTASPPPPSPQPTDRPAPSAEGPVVTPAVSRPPPAVRLTVVEQYLLDGIVRGAIDCAPVRDDLPSLATGGIECGSDDPAVARIGFFRFDRDEDMLAAYFARMDAEGVERESGTCHEGEAEGAYVPHEDVSPHRHGCFVNAEGYANYRATIPGSSVYIGVLGRTDNMGSLVDFAWRGNQDTPGGPTLWSEPGT